MTVVLHLDAEQADLVRAALGFAVVALDSRAQRVDPDGVISKAHTLQRIKVEQVEAQMNAAPIASFSRMSKENRDRVNRAFEAWPTLQADNERDALLKHLQGLCDECRFQEKND